MYQATTHSSRTSPNPRRLREQSTSRQVAFLVAAGIVAFVGTIAPAVLAAAPVTVIIDSTLSPKEMTVSPGTLVTWDNQDSDRHRMRTTSAPVEFDSGNIDEGDSFSFQFNELGTYQYRDERNDSNASYFGMIIVSDNGGDGPATPPPPGPNGSTVDIVDRSFRPPALTVAAGTTVVWNNLDGAHTVTARDNSFDSGIFEDGAYRQTFDVAGTYDYFCTLHREMVGTITVTGGDGSTPSPTDPPTPTTPTTTLAPPSPAPAPPGDVRIFDNGFTPTTKTVAIGTTVVWSNTGALPHTVTERDGLFDSSFVMTGETFQRTFDAPGTYSYLCTIHPEMVGTISVTDADGTAPPPATPPTTTPPSQAPPPPAPPGDITIFDNGFAPSIKSISTGTTLTWSNTGALPHTVTEKNGLFDSGFVMASQSYRRTFNTAGSYSYFCTIHPGMTGTVKVTGAATGEPDTGVISGDQVDDATSGIAVRPDASVDMTNSTPEPADVRVAVDIIDLDYDPGTLAIERGTTVMWTNTGQLPHTATDVNGAFDSGVMMNGDTYEHRFETLGTFDYLCTIHPNMIATITVNDPPELIQGVAAVTSDPPTAPLSNSRLSAEAGALVGLLFVTAAALTGGLGLLTRKLLSTPGPTHQ